MTRISRLLVPTDFSATSDDALAFARTLADPLDASVHLVHAFEDPFTAAAFAMQMYSTLPLALRDQLQQEIERRLAERLAGGEVTRLRSTSEVVTGPAAKVIVEHAARIGAELIVMGTHGRGGMAHLLLGSVAERVVRTAGCPVLTVRMAPGRTLKEILVPTDFSDTADAALDYAFLLAERFSASVQLLHVLDDPFITDGLAAEAYITEAPAARTAMLRDARERLAHRAEAPPPASVRIGCEVLFGNGATTIANYAAARGSDLIVMGTHGRSGLAHLLLGSVAERLVRSAPCPVLTVRHGRAQARAAELVFDVDHLPA
jgi:nucleotide-binding universal stress UspA family protein